MRLKYVSLFVVIFIHTHLSLLWAFSVLNQMFFKHVRTREILRTSAIAVLSGDALTAFLHHTRLNLDVDQLLVATGNAASTLTSQPEHHTDEAPPRIIGVSDPRIFEWIESLKSTPENPWHADAASHTNLLFQDASPKTTITIAVGDLATRMAISLKRKMDNDRFPRHHIQRYPYSFNQAITFFEFNIHEIGLRQNGAVLILSKTASHSLGPILQEIFPIDTDNAPLIIVSGELGYLLSKPHNTQYSGIFTMESLTILSSTLAAHIYDIVIEQYRSQMPTIEDTPVILLLGSDAGILRSKPVMDIIAQSAKWRTNIIISAQHATTHLQKPINHVIQEYPGAIIGDFETLTPEDPIHFIIQFDNHSLTLDSAFEISDHGQIVLSPTANSNQFLKLFKKTAPDWIKNIASSIANHVINFRPF